MKLKSIISYIEQLAPLPLQYGYDNAGLLLGNYDQEVDSALLSIDVTEEVIDEAIIKGNNLIISHHPLIFSALKKINGNNYIERCVIKAIKNDIAIYAAHTNIDSVIGGVNSKICDKLGLINRQILSPVKGQLKKLVTFVPENDAEKVRNAIFEAGAGQIGNYDQCSFNANGQGTFRGNENTNPYVGEKEKLHFENEVRIETIFQSFQQNQVIKSLLDAHPYEEVAYDVYSLDNKNSPTGMGMIAEFEKPVEIYDLLKLLKKTFNTGVIKHTKPVKNKIKKVALCGGSGSSLLSKAIGLNADIFISGDFTYHQFFETENKIMIADIGHFESEQFTTEIFYEILTKKLPNFAVSFSDIETNPVICF